MGKVAKVVVHEIREVIPPAIVFFVAFHLLYLTEAVSLEEYRIRPGSPVVATIAALIVAKAVLLVDALPLSRCFQQVLLYNILWRTLLFGIVTLLFRILEDLVHRMREHQGAGEAMRRMVDEVSWPYFWVVSAWVLILLFFYCLVTELVRTIGREQFRATLMGPRRA